MASMNEVIKNMLVYRGFNRFSYYENYWIVSNTTNSKNVFIFFSKNQKLCVKNIKEYTAIINNDNNIIIDHIIIVYNSNVTAFAKNSILNDIKYPFQLFNEIELSFDITKHALVPKHIILTKEEKFEFLNSNNFKIQNLPRIFLNDPVIKYIYGKKGDIVKIIRTSESAGESVYYRVIY